MLLLAFRRKFSAQRKFCLEKKLFSVELSLFFETAEVIPPISQSNVWEPGENPGRLRHCNGYNSQCHCPGREGGKRLEAEVRIPV